MTDEEYTPFLHGKSIAEQVWDMLDEAVMQMKDGDESKRIRATTLAEVLVMLCWPYYDDRAAVAKEAGKRYKIKKGEIPFSPTPGYKYNPPPAGTVYKYKTQPDKPVVKKKQSVNVLTVDLIHTIKKALDANMPEEALAQVYNLSLAQVCSCR